MIDYLKKHPIYAPDRLLADMQYHLSAWADFTGLTKTEEENLKRLKKKLNLQGTETTRQTKHRECRELSLRGTFNARMSLCRETATLPLPQARSKRRTGAECRRKGSDKLSLRGTFNARSKKRMPLIEEHTGITFESQTEAAIILCVNPCLISQHMNGRIKKIRGLYSF